MNSQLLAQVPIGPSFGSPFGQGLGFGNLVSTLLSNAVVFAAIILFGLILFGGVMMIHGAGNSDPGSVGKGKQAITAAILGFLIIFTSYWIIQVIEYLTGFAIISTQY